MSVKVALEHRTTYDFARPSRWPRTWCGCGRRRTAGRRSRPTRSRSRPKSHFLNWQQDPFGNWLARLVFPEKVKTLEITVGLVADLMVINPFDFFIEEYAERFPFAYEPDAGRRPGAVPPSGRRERPPSRPTPGARRCRRCPRTASPRSSSSPTSTPPSTATSPTTSGWSRACRRRTRRWRRRIGSCRDSAWLLVSLLRQYGLAARFVSGYLVQLAPDAYVTEAIDGPAGPSDGLHRPARLGRGLRARRRLGRPGPDQRAVRRRGPHPAQRDPAPQQRRADRGRDRAGRGHVRLRQRGHPDPRGPAGHRALHRRAVGAHRRARRGGRRAAGAGRRAPDDGRRADLRRRVDDMASDAVEHRRRRPGEARARQPASPSGCGSATPPAASSTAARASGTRASRCPAGTSRCSGAPTACRSGRTRRLFADPWDEAGRPSPSAARPTPRRWPAGSPRCSACPPSSCARPTRTRSPRSPTDVRRPDGRAARGRRRRPRRSRLGRQARRRRHRADRLGAAARRPARSWTSPAWRFRRGRLVLTPGTSAGRPAAAAGLDRLGGPGVRRRAVVPRGRAAAGAEGPGGHGSRTPRARRPPRWRSRRATATCTCSCRRPSGSRTTPTCSGWSRSRPAGSACPVVLEGYGPPPDPRLTQLVVTPDPGVIEVNVQPTQQLGRAARPDRRRSTTTPAPTGLTTEKFDLDGSHTGTGGGNHLTLGGRQPVDSPLLRRPDLLASLVTYWQRHPSLSYLFSGRFIGPTSQAPRFDEGRPEAVYEMEIAFAEIARLTASARGRAPAVAGRPGAAAPAHRPDRQHPPRRVLHRQALQPRLLARPARPAGAARLRDAAAPADGAGPGAAGARPGRDVLGAAADRDPLVRWGTELHEDFLLPQGVDRRHREVVADLRAHGIAFEEAWLDPFIEFRFPRHRRTTVSTGRRRDRARAAPGDRALARAGRGGDRRRHRALRRLLGRAAPGVGAGHRPGRHLVTCQGVPVPLTPTGAERRVLRRRPLPRLAAVVGAAPDDRGARAAPLRRRRHRGRRPASAARRTTSSTPAAAPTTTRRSTPTRPRPAGPAGSSRSATPPGRLDVAAMREAGRRGRDAGLPAHARPAAGVAAGRSPTWAPP